MNDYNIEYIGMLCLGAFVGGVLNYGLKHLNDNANFQETITAIFGAAFSGVVIVFLQIMIGEENKSFNNDAVYVYPIGLILALLWGQVPSTIRYRISDSHPGIKLVGWLHITSVAILTLSILVAFGFEVHLF